MCGVSVNTRRVYDGDDWIEWARDFIGEPSMSLYTLPEPEGFEDWVEWAKAVKRTFPGG